MRVLVTGTDGYIGSVLAPILAERGHEVVGVDTGFYRDGWFYKSPPTSFTRVHKDVRCIIEDDLQGYDAAVHLGELSNDPLGENDPAVTFQINHQGSTDFAAKCKAAGINRFIYSSSCSVYGAGSDGLRTEESETFPQTVYAQCKILVERALTAMADDDFSPTCLRNATAFGPSPRMRFDIVLNNLAGLAWTIKQIKMTSDGTPWRPIVHVRDICDAIACTLEAPRQLVHAQTFNVGDTRQNYQVREIAEIIADVFPDCALSFGQSDGDKRSYRVSFEKIHQSLPNFECKRDAAVGARQLFEIFSLIGMTSEDFGFRAYTRLKQLQHLIQTEQVDDRLLWRH